MCETSLTACSRRDWYRRVRHLSLLVGETDLQMCETSLTACSRRDWYRRVIHLSQLVGETGTDV